MKYIETQIGWAFLIPFTLLVIWINIANFFQLSSSPVTNIETIVMSISILIIGLLFYKMKTVIDNENILIVFGIGLIRKKVKLNSISNVTKVRNKWYNGLGIRMIRNGWLYNIHGLDAVELKYKNCNSVLRIGTGNPKEISNFIEKTINK